jgi:hypothetical protein
MHGELTERGKWCVQNNELPDESHVDELEDLFFSTSSFWYRGVAIGNKSIMARSDLSCSKMLMS